jgi:succinyl-CoA synthetase alpha subunit
MAFQVTLDLAGVLAYLAGQTVSTGNDYGIALAANSAWGSINGHGAKAATLTSAGVPAYDTVGALNHKAGTTGQEINLVCNTLAGTTGYEACLALRVYAGLA